MGPWWRYQRVMMDLSVKFEDFDITERFIVLTVDKYDLTLGIPWLEKHEPWIDCRGKAVEASRPTLSERALVSHAPTSVKSKSVCEDRQGASAPRHLWESPMYSAFPRSHSGICEGERGSASRCASGCTPGGSLVPPEQGISRRKPSVVNVVPRSVRKVLITWETGYTSSNVGNLVSREPVKANQEGKIGEDASCVGNIVPHRVGMAEDARDEASSNVGIIVPRRGRRRRRRQRKSGCRQTDTIPSLIVRPVSVSRQTPPTGRRLPEVTELLNLEAISLDDFLADLKAGNIVEMVLLRLEPTPEELNPSSVMDEDVPEDFRMSRVVLAF
ncbi:unnamed protein product [Phytophthora fragariaefolia]|uniref:Unnamed protein product n=1 Tax=Phytophthora fragariaefolia TaxID=1490495 RepID=A0A9W7D3K5_9STRA|nr:unnamed protein product [Phytophthora fragariaefolia]